MKTLLSRAAPLALCLALAAPAFAQASGPAPASAAEAPLPVLTAEQWREDLAFMAAELERRHKNLFHKVSREHFAAAVADLDRRIPTLQRNEIIVGLMGIAAMVGDGHTRVEPLKDRKFGFRSLPLKLYLFDDGLFVRAAAPGQPAELLGAKVEAIGGVPVAEAVRRASEIASGENASGSKLYVPIFLAMPDILHALKLSRTRQAAVLTLSKGKRRWTATIPAAQIDPIWPPDTDISLVTPAGWTDARITPKPPLWLQAPLDYHRLIPLPEARALYVQVNMVTDVEGQTLGQLGEKVRAAAEAGNPRAIILDLRLDRGGNGNLRNPFVSQLIKAEDEDTRLFVLTARGTFSASQFILDDLDRLSDAVFIGEPASSAPTSYGDGYRSTLPNSGITVRTSIAYWQDGQNRDPWTWVDVAASLNFADYAVGRDPALVAALAYRPKATLGEQLVAAARSGGTRAVLAALEAYRTDSAQRYADIELQAVQAAEALSAAERREEAVAVARRAAELYPESVDPALVLAHIAEWAGDKELARRAGRRTLELDPNNRAARSLMERLAAPES
jgi:tetratricopeptide (TPR) repeat protein